MKRSFFITMLGCVFLCYYSFHNKFPLLTPETGNYISAGFDTGHSWGEYGAYGKFIAHISWGRSIWMVPIGQALMLAVAIYLTFRYSGRYKDHRVPFLACIMLLTFLTSASVAVSTVSPGCFTPIMILSLGVLCSRAELEQKHEAFLLLMIFVAEIMNIRNLVLGLLFYVAYLFFPADRGVATVTWSFRWRTRRKIILGTLHVVAALITMADRNAQNSPYVLPPGSGHAVASSETTIKGKVRSGDRLMLAVGSAWSGLANVNMKPEQRPSTGDPAVRSLNEWFNWETRQYLISRQYQNWLDFNYANFAGLCVITLVIIIDIYLFIRYRLLRRTIGYYVLSIPMVALVDGIIPQGYLGMSTQTWWLAVIPALIYLDIQDLRGKAASARRQPKPGSQPILEGDFVAVTFN